MILLVYTGDSVASAFAVTAGTFAGMSIYGTVTSDGDFGATPAVADAVELAKEQRGLRVQGVLSRRYARSSVQWPERTRHGRRHQGLPGPRPASRTTRSSPARPASPGRGPGTGETWSVIGGSPAAAAGNQMGSL